MSKKMKKTPTEKRKMVPAVAPPAHRNLKPAPAPVRGRPPVWAPLLDLAVHGKRCKAGPYKNETTAAATASWFNAQMRNRSPDTYEDGWRFRKAGTYVVVRRIDL